MSQIRDFDGDCSLFYLTEQIPDHNLPHSAFFKEPKRIWNGEDLEVFGIQLKEELLVIDILIFIYTILILGIR